MVRVRAQVFDLPWAEVLNGCNSGAASLRSLAIVGTLAQMENCVLQGLRL